MSENKKSDAGPPIIFGAFLIVVALHQYKLEIIKTYLEYRYLICFVLAVAFTGLIHFIWSKIVRRKPEAELLNAVISQKDGEDALLIGKTERGKKVYLKHRYRQMHAQVVGTTNAGKTESVIVPWAVDDMKKGRGLVIIDGKSDRTLLNKIYAYARRAGREDDVRILSICDVEISHSFNPLLGGTPLEITERVFAALNFENEYFKSVQYNVFLQTLLIFEARGIKPTFLRVIEFLRSPEQIKHLSTESKLAAQIDWANDFLSLSKDEREQRTSGLVSQLQSFSVGDTACLFNVERPEIDFEQAMEKNQIIYCQLPAMRVPTLGKATGKLILQALQGAVSSRHLGKTGNKKHFSIYLDDFTEYLTQGFVTILNKSRSANVTVTFAHQALGDLSGLGDGVKNSIMTNANLKVVMRSNEPETAEYFASVVGTTKTAKVTERQKTHVLGATKTGDGSVRDAEEYIVHPNEFKRDMGPGSAVLIIPHERGSLALRVQLYRLPDIDECNIESFKKSRPLGLDPVPAAFSDENSAIPQSSNKTAEGGNKLIGLERAQEERST